MRPIGILILTCVLAIAGCPASQQLDILGAVHSEGSTHSLVAQDGNDNQRGGALGLPYTASRADANELIVTVPGPMASIAWGPFRAVSSNDVEMVGVDVVSDPNGRTTLKAEILRFNISEPIKAATLSYEAAVSGLEGMTATEAAKQVEIWKQAGLITENVLARLLEFLATL